MDPLTEIRINIDQIDKQIIDLLSKRTGFVKNAAAFKKNTDEVKSPDRVKMVIESRKQWAVESGLDPDFIGQLYSNIIDYFVNAELKQWKQKQYTIEKAEYEDLPVILELQHLAYKQEAEINRNFTIQPLCQTIEDIQNEFKSLVFLKIEQEGNIIGSVRAVEKEGTCYIGKLIVNPQFQGLGIGSVLLNSIEEQFKSAKRYVLFTSQKSTRNIAFYARYGYKYYDDFVLDDGLVLVLMEKLNQ